jgi:hypothetical protein
MRGFFFSDKIDFRMGIAVERVEIPYRKLNTFKEWLIRKEVNDNGAGNREMV